MFRSRDSFSKKSLKNLQNLAYADVDNEEKLYKFKV